MNEQLIQSIIRLYALLAGTDGILEIERDRIENFLSHNLSGRSVAFFLEALDHAVGLVESRRKDESWRTEELKRIANQVNKELRLDQKYYLYLELLELSALDGKISRGEGFILKQLPEVFNLPRQDVDVLKKLALGKGEHDFDSGYALIVHNEEKVQLKHAISWVKDDFHGLLVVLKLPSVEAYFVRFIGEKETTLNGDLLLSGMTRVWASGATLRQGQSKPIFFTDIRERFSTPTSKTAISFEARDISFQFPNGNIGLQPLTIAEKGGRMVAIMGASGSGKSTLFNVLNGNEKPSTGSVVINGVDIHQNPKFVEGAIGYVHQDDLLNEYLTVFQNLFFAAKFSFGNKSEAEITTLVEKTLVSLGLFDARNRLVGSSLMKTISGGQRKRLSIGMELIRQPSILFVDEPTSGLSSRDSMRTMDLLKNLALDGKLVFVIIHQPSAEIFKMFDRLLVLDKDGYTVYYGNTLEAIPYVKSLAKQPLHPDQQPQPEEIFDILESKVVNEMGLETEERRMNEKEWYENYRILLPAPTVETSNQPIPNTFRKPGFFKQIWLYLQRDFLAKIRDSQYMLINLLEAPILALALALIVRYAPLNGLKIKPYIFFHNENIPAYFFMSVIVALFMGMSISAEEILKDRLLNKREKFLHLNRDSYLIAKILLLFAMSALHTLAFVAISDWVLEVNDIGREFWLVMFSTACWANLLGLVLSDTFKNAVTVYFLIPLLLIPQLVLGGVVIKFDRLNPIFGSSSKVPMVGEIMVSRWAYEAIMVAQFKNNEYQKIIYDIEQRRSVCQYKRTYYLIELENMLSSLAMHPADSQPGPELLNKQRVLIRELKKEGSLFRISQNSWTGLDGHLPITRTTFEKVISKINYFRHTYNMMYQKEEKKLDSILKSTISGNPKASTLSELRQISENEQVNELVTNKSFERIALDAEGLVQKIDPVYNMPVSDGWLNFRTHFYAPYKSWLGQFFPTEFFNVGMIWVFTFFTGFVLRFRLLRRLLRIG